MSKVWTILITIHLLKLLCIFIMFDAAGIKLFTPLVDSFNLFLTANNGERAPIALNRVIIIVVVLIIHFILIYRFRKFYNTVPAKVVLTVDICASMLFIAVLILTYIADHALDEGINF